MEDVDTVKVELPEPLEERVTVDELRETIGPLGDTLEVSATVPVKPLRLAKVSLEDPEEP